MYKRVQESKDIGPCEYHSEHGTKSEFSKSTIRGNARQIHPHVLNFVWQKWLELKCCVTLYSTDLRCDPVYVAKLHGYLHLIKFTIAYVQLNIS